MRRAWEWKWVKVRRSENNWNSALYNILWFGKKKKKKPAKNEIWDRSWNRLSIVKNFAFFFIPFMSCYFCIYFSLSFWLLNFNINLHFGTSKHWPFCGDWLFPHKHLIVLPAPSRTQLVAGTELQSLCCTHSRAFTK